MPFLTIFSARHPDAVYVLDWGFLDNLKITLHKGQIYFRKRFRNRRQWRSANHTAADLRNQNILYLSHTDGNIFFDSDVKQFLAFAAEAG